MYNFITSYTILQNSKNYLISWLRCWYCEPTVLDGILLILNGLALVGAIISFMVVVQKLWTVFHKSVTISSTPTQEVGGGDSPESMATFVNQLFDKCFVFIGFSVVWLLSVFILELRRFDAFGQYFQYIDPALRMPLAPNLFSRSEVAMVFQTYSSYIGLSLVLFALFLLFFVVLFGTVMLVSNTFTIAMYRRRLIGGLGFAALVLTIFLLTIVNPEWASPLPTNPFWVSAVVFAKALVATRVDNL